MPVIAAVLGMSLGSAQAFQETAIGAAPAPKERGEGASQGAPATGQAAGLSLMTPKQKEAAEKPGNVGVTIPGLGNFGLLPKMNFGLELLYGEGDARPAVANPQEAPIDDLTIRGSVKHNF